MKLSLIPTIIFTLLCFYSCEKPEESIQQPEVEIEYIERCFVTKDSITMLPIYGVKVDIGYAGYPGGYTDSGKTNVDGEICFQIGEKRVVKVDYITCKSDFYFYKEIINPSSDLVEILLIPKQ